MEECRRDSPIRKDAFEEGIRTFVAAQGSPTSKSRICTGGQALHGATIYPLRN